MDESSGEQGSDNLKRKGLVKMTSQYVESQRDSIQNLEKQIQTLRGRREEALPPSIKPQVEAARETHLVTLQLTLETAKLVLATQTLTLTLANALKGIKEEISGLKGVVDSFGFAPISLGTSQDTSFENGGGI